MQLEFQPWQAMFTDVVAQKRWRYALAETLSGYEVLRDSLGDLASDYSWRC
jgi:hypothetical protein